MEDIEKKKILDEANVLLISNDEYDYRTFADYGFNNIDYIKSVVRAAKCFDEYPEQLEKYHIIIIGNQKVHCGQLYFTLLYQLKKICNCQPNLVVWLDRRDIAAYFNDNYTHIKASTMEGIADNIVEYALEEDVMNKVDATGKRDYQDYVNPEKLPLPTKKSDLKVLYLYWKHWGIVPEEVVRKSGLDQELGLNITFVQDTTLALEKNVVEKLGDYDIIIASKYFSGGLLNMNHESTEQCKDTGRLLTLLATYRIDDFPYNCEVSFNYGGEKAKKLGKEYKFFSALNKGDDDHFTGYYAMKCLIESVVSHYDETLADVNMGEGISDLDFRSIDDFYDEFKKEQERIEQIRELECAPIRAYDKMRSTVKSCLVISRLYGYSSSDNLTINDLRITDLGTKIKLDSIYQGKILCSITFPDPALQPYFWYDYLRCFELQTLTNKGILSKPQELGLYTSMVEDRDDLPAKPNEKQIEILEGLEKKVESNLVPYIERNNKTYKKIRRSV